MSDGMGGWVCVGCGIWRIGGCGVSFKVDFNFRGIGGERQGERTSTQARIISRNSGVKKIHPALGPVALEISTPLGVSLRLGNHIISYHPILTAPFRLRYPRHPHSRNPPSLSLSLLRENQRRLIVRGNDAQSLNFPSPSTSHPTTLSLPSPNRHTTPFPSGPRPRVSLTCMLTGTNPSRSRNRRCSVHWGAHSQAVFAFVFAFALSGC